MLPPFNYVKADSLEHALTLLGDPSAGAQILAGGTDLFVDMRERQEAAALLVDISEIPDLSAIRIENDAVRIGCCATVSAMQGNAILCSEFPVLADAVRSFADFLIRNTATIGGNLANASPGADLVVPLLALEASVVLAKHEADRMLGVDAFVRGPRQTALEPGEMLREIVIPRQAPSGQAYEKLGLKQGGAIAVVSSAVLMDVVEGACSRVRIALGAVAPRPYRSTEAEEALEGQPYSAEAFDRAADLTAQSTRPITDVRGSAEYRKAMVRALVRRGLDQAWSAGSGDGR